MMDFIKHLFGVCGEHHPNIFTLIFGSSAAGGYIYYGILKFKQRYGKRNNSTT